MSEKRIYKLYLSLFFKIQLFGMFGLIIIIGVLFILSDVFGSADENVGYLFFGLFMILIGLWNFFWLFSFPHRIIVYETGEITFKSVLRQKKTSIAEIKSIKPDPKYKACFLEIKTKNGKIKILHQFDDFHEFILHLKENNPSIELRGC